MRFLDGILKTFMPLREVEASAKNCYVLNEVPSNEKDSKEQQVFNSANSSQESVTIVQNLPSTKDDEEQQQLTKNVNRLERFIDWLVRCSGSKTAFVCIQAVLLTWAFLGIPFNQNVLWPIFISDAQAIVSYVFDTLLMRQQLKGFANELGSIAKLQSRNESKLRMVKALMQANPTIEQQVISCTEQDDESELSLKRPLFESILTKMAAITGHIGSVIFFCLTIVVWLAFGPTNKWSNQWQLYINSATSAWMVFLFSLLAVVREGHAKREEQWMKSIRKLDCKIEKKLRSLTGDVKSNEPILIQIPKTNLVQNVINVYAYIVGGLVGLFILILVFAVWAAIGPVMSFNDNWWLLIGTYSGLIGMNDGFVLRNVQHQIETFESFQFGNMLRQDKEIQSSILPSQNNAQEEEKQTKSTLTQRLSNFVCHFTAHQITVCVGALSIVGMLIGASAMHWSLTGQLICNVPPSIIESLFMQVLITGHMTNDKRKQEDVLLAFKNRQTLWKKVKGIDHTALKVNKELEEKLDQERFIEDPDAILKA